MSEKNKNEVAWSCMICKHFIHGDRPICKAFPEMIPFEIVVGDFDHRKQHPMDNGIRFLPNEMVEEGGP